MRRLLVLTAAVAAAAADCHVLGADDPGRIIGLGVVGRVVEPGVEVTRPKFTERAGDDRRAIERSVLERREAGIRMRSAGAGQQASADRNE